MAVKYRVLFRDYHNKLCKVDISHNMYTGEPIMLRGVGGQACIIDRDCSDDPYDPIVNTKATINVYQTEDSLIDVFELQVSQDREYAVEFTVDGSVKFKGWLNADGLQQPYIGAPFPLQLTAIDGLALLSDIPYTHNNLPGGRCIINYIRQLLLGVPNLGSDLTIRWYNNLVNLQYPTELDVFSGSIQWSTRGEGYNDYNGTRKDCMYILEGMLRSMQCRIVQSDGYWTIYRINDFTDAPVEGIRFKSISGLDNFFILNTTLFNPTRTIGDSPIGYDYQMVNKDQVLMVSPALKRVVTTYNQNQRDNILPNGNMDLNVLAGPPIYWRLLNPGSGSISSSGSLFEDGGYSLQVTTFTGASNILLMESSLPIDTEVLYKYIEFGFKFVITEWAGALGSAGIDADGYFIWGDLSPFNVSVIYNANGVTYYLNEFGFWTTDNLLLSVDVPNLKLNDVTQLSFNKNGEISIPLPVNPIVRTTPPTISIQFNLKPGVTMKLDDVYLRTDTNSDVYEATYNDNAKNTAKAEYELNISSSHNGFYLSNYMTSFGMSGLEKFYADGASQGTLTEINSRAILRNRYLPSLIFEGSIHGEPYSYSEIYTIKGFEGKIFMPLKSSWNSETNTVGLTCIESRNDYVSISTSHYGSNDKTKLSN